MAAPAGKVRYFPYATIHKCPVCGTDAGGIFKGPGTDARCQNGHVFHRHGDRIALVESEEIARELRADGGMNFACGLPGPHRGPPPAVATVAVAAAATPAWGDRGSDLADYVGQLENKVIALEARLKRIETPLTTYTAGRIPEIYASLDELNRKLAGEGIQSESGITLEMRNALLHELDTYAKINGR